MQAYSVPITPPPTMIMLLGSASSLSSESEQRIVFSLNGTWPGLAGRVPVAMTNFSAFSTSKSSGRSTRMLVGPSK